MTEDGPPDTTTTMPHHVPQPAAPAEPALDMDLSDAPEALPPPGADAESDEDREQGGEHGGDTDRAPT